MSRYIRTKDGIYELKENMTIENGVYSFFGKIYTTSKKHLFRNDKDLGEVVSQADNLAELCDEFVYIKDGVVNQYLTIDFKHKRKDEYCSLRNKLTANGIAEISKGISKYELENGELKFAIWTDKGLIYVAKIDENGELELI